MGAATSSRAERFPDPEGDAEVAKAQVANLIASFKADAGLLENHNKFLEEAEEDDDYLGVRESLLFRAAMHYRTVAVNDKFKGQGSADELAVYCATEFKSVLNLSTTKDDDMEVPPWWRLDDALTRSDVQRLLTQTLNPEVTPALKSAGWTLQAITHLYLKKNSISALGDEIAALVNLEVLDLSENQIEQLPESFTKLVNLRELKLNENALTKLDHLGSCTKLEKLICFKNGLKKIPPCVKTCTALKEVNFFNNKLSVTGGVQHFVDHENLEDLNIGGNKICQITIGLKWGKLKRLCASWNLITTINGFGDRDGSAEKGQPLAALEMLQLNRNQLDALDELAFAGCANLDNLDLSTNALKKLPGSLGTCTELRQVNLGSNKIEEVGSLGSCTNIEILHLSDNKLKSVDSAELEKLTKLKTLFLQGNPELASVNTAVFAHPDLNRVNLKDCAPAIKQLAFGDLEARCNAAKGRFMI